MSELYTKTFWLEALDRALKTAAQIPLVVWGLGEVPALNIAAVDWTEALAYAAGGAVVSLLTSIGSAGLATKGNASALSVPGSTPPEAG